MSAIVTKSKCAFCGAPAEYQCDWQETIREEVIPCKHRGKQGQSELHKLNLNKREHVNRWYRSCFTVMCFRCVMETGENHHRCLAHLPVVLEEDELEFARRERG